MTWHVKLLSGFIGSVAVSSMALGAATFQPYTGQSVTFVPGGVTLDEAASDPDHMAEWIGTFPEEGAIQVLGYFCDQDRLPITTEDELQTLAEQRAQALRDLLVERGVDPERISTMGHGRGGCEATAIPSVDQTLAVQSIIGIGVALRLEGQEVWIQDVVADSPAQGDGTLQAGDRIVAVRSAEDGDWTELAGLSLGQVVNMIRGAEGSEVGLRFTRESGGDTQELFLTREPLNLSFTRD